MVSRGSCSRSRKPQRDGRLQGRRDVLDRRHVRGKTKGVVVQKVRALERHREQGAVQRPGQRWTVAGWLDHWLENIARPNLRSTSYAAYRTAVVKHLVPHIGKHRLDRLEPEHLEACISG